MKSHSVKYYTHTRIASRFLFIIILFSLLMRLSLAPDKVNAERRPATYHATNTSQRIINLADVNASFVGPYANALIGYNPTYIGDINKDGYDDFAINSWGTNSVFIFIGKERGWIRNTNVQNADFIIHGEQQVYACFGDNISYAGDINNDTWPEFLIGDPCNDETGYQTGKTYLLGGNDVFLSTREMNVVDLQFSAFFAETNKPDFSGAGLSFVGDANGDGIDDFAIMADTWIPYREDVGKAYLFFGLEAGFPANNNLASSNASFRGDFDDSFYSQYVKYAGDVNGDGYDDFMFSSEIGDNERGRCYLVFGRGGGWVNNADVWNTDASFVGENEGDRSSHRLSSAGDVNGDGYSDILIGAYDNTDGGPFAGKAYLIFGKSNGWTQNINLSEAPVSFIGQNSAFNGQLGNSIAGVGDVNGDGFDDFLIAASFISGFPVPGEVYLYLGKSTGWTQVVSLPQASIVYRGEGNDDGAGIGLEYAGDINGDGFDDILLGAPKNDHNGMYSGKVYLHFPFPNAAFGRNQRL